MEKPREEIVTGSPSGIWRSGRQLVTTLNATLPPRCVKCNAPVEGTAIKRELHWVSPASYPKFLLYITEMFIRIVGWNSGGYSTPSSAPAGAKTAVVRVFICEPHRLRRRMVIVVSLLFVLAGIAAMISGFARDAVWLGILGAVAFFGGYLYGGLFGRVVFAGKITNDSMWLRGCGEEFLASFPPWNGPA